VGGVQEILGALPGFEFLPQLAAQGGEVAAVGFEG
jgi:hypothetical protein